MPKRFMAFVTLSPGLWILALYAILMSAGFSGCGDGQTTGTNIGVVKGTLIEIESGLAVTHASVTLVDPTSLRAVSPAIPTDELGRYTLVVPAGQYALLVYHDNLVIYQRPGPLLQVRGGSITRHDVKLKNSELWDGGDYHVVGTVTDAITGEPVAGAYVASSTSALHDIFAPFGGVTLPDMRVTDQRGNFTLAVLQIFSISPTNKEMAPINVTKDGYEPFSLVGSGPEFAPGFGSLLPLPDSVLTVDIRLQPSSDTTPQGTITGRLIFAGAPVAGLSVGLSLASAANPDTLPSTGGPSTAGKSGDPFVATPLPDHVGISDASGTFVIHNVPVGTYVVVPAFLTTDGYLSETKGFLGGDKIITVIESIFAANVGDLALAKSIGPLNPPDAATDVNPTPELRWQPLTELPIGYSVVDYELQMSNSYLLNIVAQRLTEPHWQVPNALAPGAHMRWLVFARVVRVATQDTLYLGGFEQGATFSVAP